MSQNYFYPAGFSSNSNPSIGTNAAPIPTSSTEIGGKNGSGNLTPVSVDASGNVNVNVLSGLVPTSYDYIALTYVPSGNGTGQVQTATYKTGGSGGTTVATLTMTYDSSDRLATVTKS